MATEGLKFVNFPLYRDAYKLKHLGIIRKIQSWTADKEVPRKTDQLFWYSRHYFSRSWKEILLKFTFLDKKEKVSAFS